MSRAGGVINLRINKQQYIKYSVIENVTLKVLSFDLWILHETRVITTRLYPVVQLTYLLAITLGILFAPGNFNLNFKTLNQVQQCPFINGKEVMNVIHGTSDNSQDNNVMLAKEIFKLKTRATDIEVKLQNMKDQCEIFQDYKLISYGLPDFASETVGGSIKATPDTNTFYEPDGNQLTIFGIPIWKPNYFSPRKVIQPWNQAGECWAFYGSHGKIEIELAYMIIISHVTLEHIPMSASLTGTIDSAPKKCSIYGIHKDRYIKIESFTYDINKTSSQTFRINNKELTYVPFKHVMFEIVSNWGNTRYTCIYRFKVHGKIFSPHSQEK